MTLRATLFLLLRFAVLALPATLVIYWTPSTERLGGGVGIFLVCLFVLFGEHLGRLCPCLADEERP